MLLGIISDTHDKIETLNTALRYFQELPVDLVVHCGDFKSPSTAQHLHDLSDALGLKIKAVLGNNDVAIDEFLSIAKPAANHMTIKPGVITFHCDDGKKVMAYHGHHKPTLNKVRGDSSADIVLLGHTHKPKIETVDGRLIVNPGSTAFAIPRSKSWKPTVAIVDTDKMSAIISTVSL